MQWIMFLFTPFLSHIKVQCDFENYVIIFIIQY